jgi:hypothetical protein
MKRQYNVPSIIAILFIFPLMFKTDIFHIMWAQDMILIIAKCCLKDARSIILFSNMTL